MIGKISKHKNFFKELENIPHELISHFLYVHNKEFFSHYIMPTKKDLFIYSYAMRK